jgi:hypothetical protein
MPRFVVECAYSARLEQGANEVIVFDVDGHPSPSLEGLMKADLGK